jgi:DNA-binding transcriptional regulator YiaG
MSITEPKKLRASVLAAAMLQTTSPGMPSEDEHIRAQLIDCQPSGVTHALKYWKGFTPVSSFANAAIPLEFCGSGSDSFNTKFIDVEEDEKHEVSAIAPLSFNKMIAAIRSSLSLQVKELAEIMHVQRPTVYSWIKGEVEPSAGNRERLQQVYRIASSWNRLCYLPAERLIRTSGTDGHSVLDLLKADNIPSEVIMSRFDALASARRQMKIEADKKIPTAEAIAKRHGLSTDDIADQQHLIDAQTGKRSIPD